MNSDIRLRRAEMRHEATIEAIKATKEVIVAVIANPIVDLVAGVAIMEYLERRKITGPIITTTTEAGILTVSTAHALAPIMPQILQAGEGALKLLPALGAL